MGARSSCHNRISFPHIHKNQTMACPTKKHLGEGARCSGLIKFLCPLREVAKALPNTTAQQRLED